MVSHEWFDSRMSQCEETWEWPDLGSKIKLKEKYCTDETVSHKAFLRYRSGEEDNTSLGCEKLINLSV